MGSSCRRRLPVVGANPIKARCQFPNSRGCPTPCWGDLKLHGNGKLTFGNQVLLLGSKPRGRGFQVESQKWHKSRGSKITITDPGNRSANNVVLEILFDSTQTLKDYTSWE